MSTPDFRTLASSLSRRLPRRPAMPEALRTRWEAFWTNLAPRERRLVAGAIAVVVLACAYLLLWEPATTGRARLAKELPALREQAAQMTTLAREARTLASHMPPPQQGEAQRAALESSLASHGLKPVQLSIQGETVQLQLDGIAFGAWTDWLASVRDAQRLKVTEAQVRYVGAPAIVNVRAVLQAPSPAGR
uniref:type II secretion system protein GspM n=1 Tax=Imbroritus primus TaxID=3058603 RepID=UPI003D161774